MFTRKMVEIKFNNGVGYLKRSLILWAIGLLNHELVVPIGNGIWHLRTIKNQMRCSLYGYSLGNKVGRYRGICKHIGHESDVG